MQNLKYASVEGHPQRPFIGRTGPTMGAILWFYASLKSKFPIRYCAPLPYFFPFLRCFEFLLHDLSNQNQKPRLPHSVLKTYLWRHRIHLQWAQIQVNKTISLVWIPYRMRSLGGDLEIKAGRSQSLDSLVWCSTWSYFKASHSNKYQTQSFLTAHSWQVNFCQHIFKINSYFYLR